MTAPLRLVFWLTVAFALSAAGTASAYHTNFVGNRCNYSPPTPITHITKDGSINSALRARWEGYQWGGGCWDDNNVDDSPGDPPGVGGTGGEGGDCSGFTFKIWRESMTESNDGYYEWHPLRDVHGPYLAHEFKAGDGAPNVTVPKWATSRMDALASSGHIGMIYTTNADGSDLILEAKGEAYGTNLWTRTYRGDSSYSGVRRVGWTTGSIPS
jgi:hypothetical protein